MIFRIIKVIKFNNVLKGIFISTVAVSSIFVNTPEVVAQEEATVDSSHEKNGDHVLVNFKPISIETRISVGSIKLAEMQALEEGKSILVPPVPTINVVPPIVEDPVLANNSMVNNEGATTASGNSEDTSWKVREALQRADALLEKREEERRLHENRVVLPPVISESSTPSEILDAVDNIANTSSPTVTLDSLNIKHDSSKAAKIVDSALSQIGVPYVWGGESLAEGGFDCSGLVQWAYGQHGVNLSRTTYTQVKEGQAVSIGDMKLGDLVFYGGENSPSHVALYIGDGQIVHSPYTGSHIQVTSATIMEISAVRRIV